MNSDRTMNWHWATRAAAVGAVLLGNLSFVQQSAGVVIPSPAASSEGNSNDFGLLPSGGGLVVQQFYNPADLTGLSAGAVIVGFRLRLDAIHGTTHSPIYPDSSFTWSRFDVKMGEGKSPVDLTPQFATNYVGVPTQVRTGSLTMGAGFFPGPGTPNPWSPVITFNTPYFYGGGVLAIETRNDGPAPASPLFLDGHSVGLSQFNIGNDNASFANSVFYVQNWVMQLEILSDSEPGDANHDGFVDGGDYTIWADHYTQTGQTWETGDFTGDGIVDGGDYTIWADNYDPAPAFASAIPEPSTLALAGIGALALLARRGATRRRAR